MPRGPPLRGLSPLGALPPLLGIGGIFLLSATPGGELPTGPPIPHLDKIAHAILFALLLFSCRFWRGRHRSTGEWLPGAIAACIVVALGDEWHQSAVPGRFPDPVDLLADAVGIALGSAFWACWPGIRGHRTLS